MTPIRTLRAAAALMRRLIPSLKRLLSSSSQKPLDPGTLLSLRAIRNIGISAHIDAGKTTATERMLYFSGAVQRFGEVHNGDTVTDFLPQERERGITIKAAAITFGWRGNTVNLIDTPGHVDFTIEVERSFRVLDGAVLLYDSVHGVEAQSETVWAQANRYGVARIAFANKMDREGASYAGTISSIENRLQARCLPLHYPLGEAGGFAGVVDLLTMCVVSHPHKDGKAIHNVPLNKMVADAKGAGRQEIIIHGRSDGQGLLHLNAEDTLAASRAAKLRLLERLADLDEVVGDAYLNALQAGIDLADTPADPQHALGTACLKAAIRRVSCTPGTTALPLLCGSAYKNKGVQLVLDAVGDFLPSPLDKLPPVEMSAAGVAIPITVSPTAPLRALAFKVQNHPSRGPLVYFRVYSGVLTRGMTLVVPQAPGSAKVPVDGLSVAKEPPLDKKHLRERPSKLLQLMADDQREVEAVPCGHIGAAVGLKHVKTGDTLCNATDINPAALPRLTLPQPVFTAALEVGGPSEQKLLEEALVVLTREDPSLRVTLAAASDSGQTLLSGMGELHLDISADRLRREYNVPVTLGRMRVAYRETLAGACGAGLDSPVEADGEATYDRTMGGKRHWAKLGLRVTAFIPGTKAEWSRALARGDDPLACKFLEGDETMLCIVNMESHGSAALPGKLNKGVAPKTDADENVLRAMPADLSDALREGIAAAFGRGPTIGSPLVGLCVTLLSHKTEVGPDTTPAAMRAVASRTLSSALSSVGVDVLEPSMDVHITCPEGCTGSLLSDLSAARRGRVKEVVSTAAVGILGDGANGTTASTSPLSGKTNIRADVPLRELVGYSTALRSVTGGEGSFSMEFALYVPVGPMLQKKIASDPSSA